MPMPGKKTLRSNVRHTVVKGYGKSILMREPGRRPRQMRKRDGPYALEEEGFGAPMLVN
jgi:hypothetical protein